MVSLVLNLIVKFVILWAVSRTKLQIGTVSKAAKNLRVRSKSEQLLGPQLAPIENRTCRLGESPLTKVGDWKMVWDEDDLPTQFPQHNTRWKNDVEDTLKQYKLLISLN